MELKADGFSIYIILGLAYYAYQAYMSYKKKQNQAPEANSNRPKKKSFLDEILEEVKKQQNSREKKTRPALPKPQPVQARKPAKPTSKPVTKPRSTVMSSTITGTLDISYLDTFESIEYSDTRASDKKYQQNESSSKNQSAGKGLSGKKLNAIDMVISQIILERKF